MQVGKANYTQKSNERTTYYRLGMKDDQRELVLRVAPPVKTLAEDGEGKFAVYIKQHFGYTIKSAKGDPIPQTFLCIEQKDRHGNITQECPECENNAIRKKEKETLENELKGRKASDEEIAARCRPLTDYLKSHNLDKKWNFLAKNRSGNWGIGTIGHKCFQSLFSAIKALQTKGVEDPVGVDKGVWFTFTRTGLKYNDITDTVDVLSVPGQEAGSFRIAFDSLTDTDFKAIEKLPDLKHLGRRLTYDQIALLVSSGGEESVVKSVMESGQRREKSPSQDVSTKEPTTTVSPSSESAGVLPSVEMPEKGPAEVVTNDEVAKLEAMLAKAKAAASAPAKAPVAQPTKIQKALEADVEDFLATYGDGE